MIHSYTFHMSIILQAKLSCIPNISTSKCHAMDIPIQLALLCCLLLYAIYYRHVDLQFATTSPPYHETYTPKPSQLALQTLFERSLFSQQISSCNCMIKCSDSNSTVSSSLPCFKRSGICCNFLNPKSCDLTELPSPSQKQTSFSPSHNPASIYQKVRYSGSLIKPRDFAFSLWIH